eukprot:jgi/Galph1/5964/GphlegSOOS_G4620.1
MSYRKELSNASSASLFRKLNNFVSNPKNSERRASISSFDRKSDVKNQDITARNAGRQSSNKNKTQKYEVTPEEKWSLLECIRFLTEEPHALEAEGIFRVSGTFSKVQKLRHQLRKGLQISTSKDDDSEIPDSLTVADLLKDLLRNLSRPILPCDTGRLILENSKTNPGFNLLQIAEKNLSSVNRELFERILELLAKTSSLSLFNQMNSKNLATVFAPTMIDWDPLQPNAREELQVVTEAISSLIQDHSYNHASDARKVQKSRRYHSTPLHLQPNPFYNPPKFLPAMNSTDHISIQNRLQQVRNMPSMPKIKSHRTLKPTSFDASFHAVDIHDKGRISASEGITFFSKFHLSLEQVALIWNLADTRDTGSLGIQEWRIAMALCLGLSRNCEIPSKLPAALEWELHIPPSYFTEYSENRHVACESEKRPSEEKEGHFLVKLETPQQEVSVTADNSSTLVENRNIVNISNVSSNEEETCPEIEQCYKDIDKHGAVTEDSNDEDVLFSIKYLWVTSDYTKKPSHETLVADSWDNVLARRKLLGRGLRQDL